MSRNRTDGVRYRSDRVAIEVQRRPPTAANGQSADSVSTAKWDGPKLTLVTKQEMNGQVSEFTQVWTVEGSTLTVETSNAGGTLKRVYKKS